MTEPSGHIPVLENAVIEALNIKPNGIYVDATFGRGGHARQILNSLSKEGRLVILDKDLDAIEYAKNHFGQDKRVFIYHDSFANLSVVLENNGFNTRVDGLLVDLGVSSNQLDEKHRGFSFSGDGPLDMRMNQTSGISAQEWLNQASIDEMARVFYTYGEHPKARMIAKAVAQHRSIKPFTSTRELAELCEQKFANPREKKHPATLIFQAIRIEINNEIEELDLLLSQVVEVLNKGGRFVALSFHSLEDRRVKRFIQATCNPNAWQDKFDYGAIQKQPKMKLITKRKADSLQIKSNPRARSVVMRVAEKI